VDDPLGAAPAPASDASPRRIFGRFLRFGLLAWGGPVAQIAMLRRELVDEERWLDGGRFNRLLAVFQVLPGPEAHELAVHLGFLRGRRIGGLLAGLGFMLPGFVLMLALSWLYFQVDLTQAAVGAALLGAQVAVIALVVRATERIGRHIVVSPLLAMLAAGAALATLAGVPFPIVLGVAGLVHVAADRVSPRVGDGLGAIALVAAVGVLASAIASQVPLGGLGSLGTGALGPGGVGAGGPTIAVEPSVVDLFLSGLLAGLLTFGGAYTAIPFIRSDAVGSGWLTDAQFLDGLALSGILPAPLIIFGTFVGYVGGGLPGAVAMTAGIFLPAFSFSLLFGDRIEAAVEHHGLRRLLEGVAAGVVGLIAVTAFGLALAVAQRTPALMPAAVVFVAALGLFVAWRSRAAVPLGIAASALAGWLLFGGLAG
jgi:chromate transporter